MELFFFDHPWKLSQFMLTPHPFFCKVNRVEEQESSSVGLVQFTALHARHGLDVFVEVFGYSRSVELVYEELEEVYVYIFEDDVRGGFCTAPVVSDVEVG
jgi:hypothetical protein